MTTVGPSSSGVVLSTGRAGGVPSGDICYFFSDSVDIDDVSMDKIKRLTANSEYIIDLGKNWTDARVNDARIVDNTNSTLNSYRALFIKWKNAKTQVYFWVTDGSNYFDFFIDETAYDYLPCLIEDKVRTSISRGEKTMNIKLGKYGS
jgi:hypothetical protein